MSENTYFHKGSKMLHEQYNLEKKHTKTNH